MSITAIVENDTIKLPVHVPDGTKVEITLPGEDASASGETADVTEALLTISAGVKNLPADLAAQHAGRVDWAKSASVTRRRAPETRLAAETVMDALAAVRE